MTKVKICGLTRREDVVAVNAVRPEYIGFIFAQSRRQIDLPAAVRLKSALNKEIKAVGVFVNEKIEMIEQVVREQVIDAVQLHGYEETAYLERLRARVNVPVIKAVRVQSSQQIQYFSGFPCDYLLLDAYVRGERGGSGKTFDWGMIPKLQKPYFLAGGLDSRTVAKAIELLHPYCVDVSSGVETNGLKDSNKIEEFVNQVRSVK